MGGLGHNNQQLNGAASSTSIVTGNQFSSANNVNQFTAQQNRPPRQDQNLDSLRNSGSNSAGQCGKRNAHGINGRVLQDSQFQEGDTDFESQIKNGDKKKIHSKRVQRSAMQWDGIGINEDDDEIPYIKGFIENVSYD